MPIEAFAFKNKATGRRQSRCRSCHQGARRDHYLANKPKILKQVDRRNRIVRKQNVARVVDYLLTHPCVDCGESDPVVLHFDHVDPATKRMNIARLILQATWARVLEEIAKCEVRCANCHQRRTAKQFGWLRAALANDHAVLAQRAE